jgi:hypothetical protein
MAETEAKTAVIERAGMTEKCPVILPTSPCRLLHRRRVRSHFFLAVCLLDLPQRLLLSPKLLLLAFFLVQVFLQSSL